MNYTEVRREIGRRLGDPDLKKYRGLVSQCFVSSMCEQLEDEESYNIEEISKLIFEDTILLEFNVLNQAVVNIKDDAIKLLDVYQNVVMATAGIVFHEITPIEFKRMALERAFRPTEREIFWFRRGIKIHFITSDQVVGSTVVHLQYLMNLHNYQ